MRAKVITFLTLATLLILCATPAYGQEAPPLPHAFYGTVEINNSPAPVESQVEARGEGVRTGIEGNPIGTIAVGIYGSPDPMEPKLIVQGDIPDGATITFYVNGVSTGQTAEWHSGEVTELDLTVTIPRPPGAGGGGGSGGSGSGDTTHPRILDTSVSTSNITETSADISWKTQEKSDSQVEYRWSSHKLSPLDTEMVFRHLVHLTNLAPGTTYHYWVMSRDSAGNLAVSDEYTFTTGKDVPGSYSVDVDGLSGSFTVKGKPASPPLTPPSAPMSNWPLIWGIIAGVVVVGVIIFLVIRKRAI